MVSFIDITFDGDHLSGTEKTLHQNTIRLTYIARSITALTMIYTLLFHFEIITTRISLLYILLTTVVIYTSIFILITILAVQFITQSSKPLKFAGILCWTTLRYTAVLALFIIGFAASTEELIYQFQLYAITAGVLFLEVYIFREY